MPITKLCPLSAAIADFAKQRRFHQPTVTARLQACTHELELAINETPTGEMREMLCDAQIYIMRAITLAQKGK